MTHPVPPPDRPDRPALLNAFARIVWEVQVVLGGRMRPMGATPVIPVALAVLIHGRVQRLRARFVTLVEQALAGTLKPIRPRVRRATPADAARRSCATKTSLPRAAGWLTELCPGGSYPQRSIGHAVVAMPLLLEDETLLRLLASDQRFGRTLRPLWRMLRAEPPPECLRLPPRPRRQRAARQKPDIGQPIPNGVRRRDLQASRAMAPPRQAPAQPPPSGTAPSGTAPEWTPTHLTLGRRVSVLDPLPGGWRRDAGWAARRLG